MPLLVQAFQADNVVGRKGQRQMRPDYNVFFNEGAVSFRVCKIVAQDTGNLHKGVGPGPCKQVFQDRRVTDHSCGLDPSLAGQVMSMCPLVSVMCIMVNVLTEA